MRSASMKARSRRSISTKGATENSQGRRPASGQAPGQRHLEPRRSWTGVGGPQSAHRPPLLRWTGGNGHLAVSLFRLTNVLQVVHVGVSAGKRDVAAIAVAKRRIIIA